MGSSLRPAEKLIAKAYLNPRQSVERREPPPQRPLNGNSLRAVPLTYQTPKLVPWEEFEQTAQIRMAYFTALVPSAAISKFVRLRKEWRKASRHLSRMKDIVALRPYAEIMAMGPRVVPLLIAELERSPDWWFYALELITGQNPVTDEHRGDLDGMAKDWIRWWNEDGASWLIRN